MVSMFDSLGSDPADMARTASSDLTKGKEAFAPYRAFVFNASSPEEFDERVSMVGQEFDTKVIASLRREFIAGDECGGCPQGEKCVCSHGSCHCEKTSKTAASKPCDNCGGTDFDWVGGPIPVWAERAPEERKALCTQCGVWQKASVKTAEVFHCPYCGGDMDPSKPCDNCGER